MQRLKKEMRDLISDPAPHIRARPNEKNILEFHYVIEGPKDSPYAGGWYWGKVSAQQLTGCCVYASSRRRYSYLSRFRSRLQGYSLVQSYARC